MLISQSKPRYPVVKDADAVRLDLEGDLLPALGALLEGIYSVLHLIDACVVAKSNHLKINF